MVKLSGADAPERLNTLAREQMKLRLLADILFDIQVCRLEGLEYKKYLLEIKDMIDGFLARDF